MKQLIILLLLFISFANKSKAGIPEDKDAWMEIERSGPGKVQINTLDAKAVGSKITVGITRRQGENEQSDGYYVMSWTGKVQVDCKKFKMKITAKTGGGLFPATSTYKITPDSIGYPLADNLCYLTGVEGYTKNEVQPEWATKVIKTIESKPIKKYVQQGAVSINCDSPVWKNKPRCN